MRRSRTPRRHLVRLALAPLAVGLVLAATAIAKETSVVSPGEKVAGRSYSDWLEKWWQVRFATPPRGSICQKVGDVDLLIGAPFPPGTKTCKVRAGHPVYVNGPASECSNREDPKNNTAKELKRCAKRGFKGLARPKVKIDGEKLRDPQRWKVASGVFKFRLAKNNILGSEKRHGRGAAYGEGFILEGLDRGKHIVRQVGELNGDKIVLKYKLKVRG